MAFADFEDLIFDMYHDKDYLNKMELNETYKIFKDLTKSQKDKLTTLMVKQGYPIEYMKTHNCFCVSVQNGNGIMIDFNILEEVHRDGKQ